MRPDIPSQFKYRHPWRRARKRSVFWGEWVAYVIGAAIAILVFLVADALGVESDQTKLLLAGVVYLSIGVLDLVRVRYLGEIEQHESANSLLSERIDHLENEVNELRHPPRREGVLLRGRVETFVPARVLLEVVNFEETDDFKAVYEPPFSPPIPMEWDSADGEFRTVVGRGGSEYATAVFFAFGVHGNGVRYFETRVPGGTPAYTNFTFDDDGVGTAEWGGAVAAYSRAQALHARAHLKLVAEVFEDARGYDIRAFVDQDGTVHRSGFSMR